jgi:hypothetical protein
MRHISKSDAEVIGPPAEHAVQLVYELCGLLPGSRADGQRVDGFDHALDALLCEDICIKIEGLKRLSVLDADL